jgi:hypothetical protein
VQYATRGFIRGAWTAERTILVPAAWKTVAVTLTVVMIFYPALASALASLAALTTAVTPFLPKAWPGRLRTSSEGKVLAPIGTDADSAQNERNAIDADKQT